ncbi:hypothetical protein C0995_001477, partial [Termitomyces sp. Mi166
MTDPDDCHANRRNLRANTVVVPPLHFESGGMGSGGMRSGGNNQTASGSSERPIRQPAAAAAADPFSMVIPETVLPEGWDAPLLNPMPRMVPPAPAPMYRRNNNMLRPVNQSIVAIPETVLPEGWDAPLQNPMPRMVPPAPAPMYRRNNNNPMPKMMLPSPAPVYRDSMLRIKGDCPIYAQLYFYDHNQQLAFCQQGNARLDPQVMASLQDMLSRVNPFIDLYKQARQIMGEVPEGQPQTLA